MDKYNVAEYASAIASGLKDIETYSGSLITDDSILSDITGNPSSLFENALNSPFNSKQEVNAKKVLAAAMIIAKNTGSLPLGIPSEIDSIQATSIADESISRMKAAILTSLGSIDVYEAADRLIDQATARALAVSDEVVAKGVDFAINKIGQSIAKSYPPAKPIISIIKQCQPIITAKAQGCVKKGIQKLNTFAKSAVRKIGQTIKSKVTSKIKVSLFSKKSK